MGGAVELAKIEDRATLEVVLHHLLDVVGLEVEGELVARAARTAAGDDALARLVDAAGVLGMRGRVVHAKAAEILPHVRSDLPVLTPNEAGWLLVERVAFGRARVRRIPDPRGASWLPLRSLMSDEVQPWVFVEPALAASALATPAGHDENGDAHHPDPHHAHAHATPSQRLRGLLWAEGPDVAVVVVYAIAVGILTLATPLAVQALVNWLAFGALLQPIFVLSLLLTLFLFVAAGLRGLQRWTVEIVQRRMFVRMVADVSERLVGARGDAFDEMYGPELVNRYFDVFTVQKAVATLLLDGVTAALTAAVGLLVLGLYHPYLLVFGLVIVAAMGGIFLLGRGAERTAIDESKVKYAVAGWLEEVARQPALFKRGGVGLALDRSDRLTRKYLAARDRHFWIFFRQYVGVQVLQVVVGSALLVVSGWLVLEGELTLGQLVAAEFIVTAALGGFAKFAEKLDTIYDLLAAIDKLGHLVDVPQDPRGGLLPEAPASGAAAGLVGVVGGFVTGATFGPVDLQLAAGERVAVLGAPGTGKTTMADLLAGARPPVQGLVLRDGTELGLLRSSRVHGETMVARTGEIIHATVLDNLTLGREIREEDVWATLRQIGIEAAIGRLPRKLHATLGANGAPLSEGTARALVVARSILARPRLLIVDGLLDGVPGAAREPLLAALTDPSAPWTLLLLTEDPALARRLDRTLEFVDGGLVERPSLRRV